MDDASIDERFRIVFEDAPIGMALIDLDGRLTRVNRALCQILRRGPDELVGRTVRDITDPRDLDVDLDHMRRLVAGEIPRYAMEKRYLAPDGTSLWAQLSVSLLRDADGRPEGFIAQVQDIAERRRMQDRLRHEADHDDLSGLWNRRRFEEELRRELARARREGPTTALLLFDLDGLKRINDTRGHAGGDALIREVAGSIGRRLRGSDSFARIGGDEFAILLVGVRLETARTVAQELCATIRFATGAAFGEATASTASVGLVMVDPVLGDEQALLGAADRAMYRAKAHGGDGVEVAS